MEFNKEEEEILKDVCLRVIDDNHHGTVDSTRADDLYNKVKDSGVGYEQLDFNNVDNIYNEQPLIEVDLPFKEDDQEWVEVLVH